MGRFLATGAHPCNWFPLRDSTANQLTQFYMGDNNQRKRAIELLREGVFPADWAMVPVAGKSTYVKGWTKIALDRDKLELEYRMSSAYRGLGVVTGGFSNGLIALDIDGPTADERYKELAGEEYRSFGQEETWTVTSGREGRRQIFYRVPDSLVAELTHVKKVIRRVDGSWHLGAGDPLNKDQLEQAEQDSKYQELVLRFNSCQSVLPGSPHPITKKAYWFANDCREVALAPSWIIDVLMQYREPVGFLSNAALAAIREDLDAVKGDTKNSTNQMRGWFFNTSGAYKKLIDEQKLEELVFTPERFPLGFDWKDKGDGVHRQNYCPWHGGESGTSFQYNAETGCWFCHAEGVGGDPVDFIHKSRMDDIQAPRPIGMDLEIILRELSDGLGIDFETINTQKTQEQLGLRCSPEELLDKAAEIIRNKRNPIVQELAISDLITQSGLYSYRPKQLISMVRRNMAYTRNGGDTIERKHGWWDEVDRKAPVIPGWISTGCQYMIHSRGGVGKSATAVAIARAIGTGETMKIRGMDIGIDQGNVIWISNDQSDAQLLELFEEQNVCPADSSWLTVLNEWTSDLHDDLVKVIKRRKPKLVVMDSLSTVIEGDENKGEFADYLYQLARCNGDLGSDFGFPATAILWIHHDRKDGTDFRGSDRLANAVDEVWSLRKMTREEEDEFGLRKRILTIGKSRNNRSGDRFMTTMHDDFTLELADATPIASRDGSERQGNFKKDELMLKVLAESAAPMDRAELLKALNAAITHEGERPISDSTLRNKFLKRWVNADLVIEASVPTTNGKGGRPRKVYSSRGVRERGFDINLLDTPEALPENVSRWLGRFCINPQIPETIEGFAETPETAHRVTHEVSAETPDQGFMQNQPDSERVDAATVSGEEGVFVNFSPSLGEGGQPDTTHGVTDNVDLTDFGGEDGFD